MTADGCVAKTANQCEGLGGVGTWLPQERDAENARQYEHRDITQYNVSDGGALMGTDVWGLILGRGLHSSTIQLNSSRF
jgi:hypothetical protein